MKKKWLLHRKRGGVHSENVAGPQHDRIYTLMYQVERSRLPFRKKLFLDNMNLTADSIPVGELCGKPSLKKKLLTLSLARNILGPTVPAKLVQSLPRLQHLNLSQCDLGQLPDYWNLPMLVRLDLSHNRLSEFLLDTMLQGLPKLRHLNMKDNKLLEITVPSSSRHSSKLETLDLSYNEICSLPDKLDWLLTLRVFKLKGNFLTTVPERVCNMHLRTIDVSFNPTREPPLDVCERGIVAMRRYWRDRQEKKESETNNKVGVEDSTRGRQLMERVNLSSHKSESNKQSPSDCDECSSNSSSMSHRDGNEVGKLVHQLSEEERQLNGQGPTCCDEQVEKIEGLPTFKDQAYDRSSPPCCNEVLNPSDQAADFAEHSDQIKPEYKDQVRAAVLAESRSSRANDLEPTVVYADARLLDVSNTSDYNNIIPARVLEVDGEPSYEVQTKREIAKKDAEIQRLREKIEEMSRAVREAEQKAADLQYENNRDGVHDDNAVSATSELPPEIVELKKQVDAMSRLLDDSERRATQRPVKSVKSLDNSSKEEEKDEDAQITS